MSALELALELREYLRPGCDEIEIAGSVRRGKVDPKDIELVAIPAIEAQVERNLFGEFIGSEDYNWLDHNLKNLHATGVWQLDTVLKRNGPRYKRLRHTTGMCCDLFITDARSWGIIFTIRTGPGEFSKGLVIRALRMGMFVEDGLLHKHERKWKLNQEGERIYLPCESGPYCDTIIPTLTEPDFFAALGLPYTEPAQRK